MTEPPAPRSAQAKLVARLEGHLDQSTAADLVEAMVQPTGPPDVPAMGIELLNELQGASSKAAQGAMKALPELRRRGALHIVVSWLDLGVALAGSSGAAAMKYFKESQFILDLMQPAAARSQV